MAAAIRPSDGPDERDRRSDVRDGRRASQGPRKLREYHPPAVTSLEQPPEPHVAGEVRVQSWRRVWVATGAGPLTCPEGHRFKDTDLVWQEGCLRCKHKAERGDAECGKLVYLLGGGLVNPRGQPLVILAEISAGEMRTMASERMDHDRALEFLGIRFPG